jgi:hypothetical protein
VDETAAIESAGAAAAVPERLADLPQRSGRRTFADASRGCLCRARMHCRVTATGGNPRRQEGGEQQATNNAAGLGYHSGLADVSSDTREYTPEPA